MRRSFIKHIHSFHQYLFIRTVSEFVCIHFNCWFTNNNVRDSFVHVTKSIIAFWLKHKKKKKIKTIMKNYGEPSKFSNHIKCVAQVLSEYKPYMFSRRFLTHQHKSILNWIEWCNRIEFFFSQFFFLFSLFVMAFLRHFFSMYLMKQNKVLLLVQCSTRAKFVVNAN